MAFLFAGVIFLGGAYITKRVLDSNESSMIVKAFTGTVIMGVTIAVSNAIINPTSIQMTSNNANGSSNHMDDSLSHTVRVVNIPYHVYRWSSSPLNI